MEEVFVFADDTWQPMAEVMQEDADDGHSSQGITFRSCQKFCAHYFLLCSFVSFFFCFGPPAVLFEVMSRGIVL